MPDTAFNTGVTLTLPAGLDWLAPLETSGLVRIGAPHDGGYVLPARLVDDTDVLISFGIGFNWEFEREFRRLRPSATIHAYDHTVSVRRFRKFLALGILAMLLGRLGWQEISNRRRLLQDFKTFFADDATHFPARVHNRVVQPGDVDIASIFARAGSGRKFVKVDIEGSEYRILEDVLKHSSELLGLVVEFHDTEPLREVFRNAVQRLTKDFVIVHVHANNFVPPAADGLPECLEVTFVRREYCTGTRRRSALPVPDLDAPNDPDQPDFSLRFDLGKES